MTEKSKSIEEYKRENKSLLQQLQLKNQEIDDLNFQIKKLLKEHTIWEHLENGQHKNEDERDWMMNMKDNMNVQSQIANISNQNEHLHHQIKEQKQKNDDLKYQYQELKKLKEKSEEVYEKQIKMLRQKNQPFEEIQILRLQKEKLEKKIYKCDEIGRQMEDYYLHQIQIRNNKIQEQNDIIHRLECKVRKQGENEEMRHKLREISSMQVINRENFSEKYYQYQIKDHQEKQIGNLKDQIKFLIAKLESLQNQKQCCESNSSNNGLTQSKFILSTSSTESFRLTPNHSFSSSIKESLSRRNTAELKTPNKTQRQTKNINFVLDRSKF